MQWPLVTVHRDRPRLKGRRRCVSTPRRLDASLLMLAGVAAMRRILGRLRIAGAVAPAAGGRLVEAAWLACVPAAA